MAVGSNKVSINMKLIVDKGVDPDTGKSVTQVRTFSNIREDATDENLFLVGKTLGSLQLNPVVAIRKQETYELVSE